MIQKHTSKENYFKNECFSCHHCVVFIKRTSFDPFLKSPIYSLSFQPLFISTTDIVSDIPVITNIKVEMIFRITKFENQLSIISIVDFTAVHLFQKCIEICFTVCHEFFCSNPNKPIKFLNSNFVSLLTKEVRWFILAQIQKEG